MKRTKYNTKMHLSQLTQVAATAEMGWGREKERGERERELL